MKKLLVMLVVLVGIGLCAWGDVGDMLSGLVGDDCISAEEIQPILTALTGPDYPALSVAGACATIGELSGYLFDALGLQGTFLERLFGMTEAEKLAVCQRNGVMVSGAAGDSFSGLGLAAIFAGLAKHLSTTSPFPESIVLDLDALAELFVDAQGLLPPGALETLIPGLLPATPTS